MQAFLEAHFQYSPYRELLIVKLAVPLNKLSNPFLKGVMQLLEYVYRNWYIGENCKRPVRLMFTGFLE